MQIPDYWAEARVTDTVDGSKRTIQRWGWSDESAAVAAEHAESRAQKAMAELQAGEDVRPRERKLIYGDDGMPIREEVLARRPGMVVTRNSYGARCLNVEDVLFADMDFRPALSPFAELFWRSLQRVVVVGLLLIALLQFGSQQWVQGCFWLAGTCAGVVILAITYGVITRMPSTMAAEKRRMHMRVATAAQKTSGRFALYETPKGLRALALHRPYDPTSTETSNLFADLKTDKAYAQLCALQACFRARLTAKPWRIGVVRPPTRAVWPLQGDKATAWREWVMRYEVEADKHAACRYLRDVGSAAADPHCEEVQRVHDELSKARTSLPMG